MRARITIGGRTHDAELQDNRLAFRGAVPVGSAIMVDGVSRRVARVEPSQYVPGVTILVLGD